jgi:hypothetical protein
MDLVSMVGAKDFYYGANLKKLAHLGLSNLSFEMNTETIPAKGTAEGWIFFYKPINSTATPSRLEISVTDDHGNTARAARARTTMEGGLRGAPIPVIGVADLSGYNIRRFPG